MKALCVGGVVLAAGASARMGRPKALLTYGLGTFVGQVVQVLRGAGVDAVVVVTREELKEAVGGAVGERATVCVNPSPAAGMGSSIRCGLDALCASAEMPDGFLLALVDQPDIAAETVERLLDAFHAEPARIVVPRSPEGRRGHPVIFPRDLFDELRQEHAEGIRAVVWRNAHRVCEVAVDDVGPFRNVNTPEDLARLEGGGVE